MSTIETGGPAFPVSTSDETDGHQDGPNTWQFPGMTLRDYFAAKAMQGYYAMDGSIDCNADDIAADAYAIADAMLAARKAGTQQ